MVEQDNVATPKAASKAEPPYKLIKLEQAMKPALSKSASPVGPRETKKEEKEATEAAKHF